ncbi:hypothetical protein [Clostridium thermobutyricum]|uniref:hypothetical protein n=1 Tax=Clostridium thermobutyricum TaxID=29372 RepID=UPI0018A8E27E|nr:hypothetical protein [Clostridium thermobutyricum]
MYNKRKEITKDKVLELINEYCELTDIKGDFSNLLTLDVYTYKNHDEFPGVVKYKEIKHLSESSRSNKHCHVLLKSILSELLRNILRLEIEAKLEDVKIMRDIDLFYFVLGNNELLNSLYYIIYEKIIHRYLENHYSSENLNLVSTVILYPCDLSYGMIDVQVKHFVDKTYRSLLIDYHYSLKGFLIEFKEDICRLLEKELQSDKGKHVVNNLDEYINHIAKQKINFTIGLQGYIGFKSEKDICDNLLFLVSKGLKSVYYDKLKDID